VKHASQNAYKMTPGKSPVAQVLYDFYAPLTTNSTRLTVKPASSCIIMHTKITKKPM